MVCFLICLHNTLKVIWNFKGEKKGTHMCTCTYLSVGHPKLTELHTWVFYCEKNKWGLWAIGNGSVSYLGVFVFLGADVTMQQFGMMIKWKKSVAVGFGLVYPKFHFYPCHLLGILNAFGSGIRLTLKHMLCRHEVDTCTNALGIGITSMAEWCSWEKAKNIKDG